MLFGCSSVSERVVEDAMEQEGNENVDVDMNRDGSMEIESDTVKVTTGQNIPADWPQDIPLLPGATIESSMFGTNKETNEVGGMITLSTEMSPQDALDFYADALGSDGWTETARATMGPSSVLSMTKDGRATAVMVQSDGAKSSVTLTIGNE